MKRYGESFILKQDLMDTIASYMDDHIREDLHFRIAPCSPDLFLREYTKRDPDFVDLLKSEFSIEMELDTRELAEKVVNCLSDGYDDEENRDETENLLYDSLSQISNDNPIKIVLVRLCETIEELQS